MPRPSVGVSPLPLQTTAPFLSRVPEPTAFPDDSLRAPAGQPNRTATALAAWSVTAGTALGMLLGLGRRHSTLWRPLNATAHVLLGARADDVWGFQLDVTPAGCAVVLVMSAVAAIATATLTSSRRTAPGAIAAIGVVLVGYLAHLYIAGRSAGGLAAFLSPGELRALYASVAIALPFGMRYAFSTNDTLPLK